MLLRLLARHPLPVPSPAGRAALAHLLIFGLAPMLIAQGAPVQTALPTAPPAAFAAEHAG